MATTAVARPGFGARVGAFFRNLPTFYHDVMAEMRKVTWPDRAQLQDATIKIIAFVLFIGLLIAAMDFILQGLLITLPQFLFGR